ncbi:uncharacterized protein LOC103574453 [Microplitis demolitor]|uniref:uncharacterized protein LOC103574453 n=1 Tax=Microplitis demolitor TaxID=69319 RepID=UPI0004CD7338|nr:uncharacterized protein LOC103574453 [Microplitis demolitor]
MAKNIMLFLTFFSFCIAITFARYDPTNGRFNYRCLQNSAIVSYDAPALHKVSFSVWSANPNCSKDFDANEKAQWEMTFNECATPGTRYINMDLRSYRPGNSDASLYSLKVDCDNESR